jgi:hypothetical protein
MPLHHGCRLARVMANHRGFFRGCCCRKRGCRDPNGRAGDEVDWLVALAPGFSLRCHVTVPPGLLSTMSDIDLGR